MNSEKLAANLPKIFTFNFFYLFLVAIPVIVPYWKSFGLTLTNVYQLQAIFGGVLILLDVPAGYLSDLLGRKRILITVGVLNGLAFTWLAFGTTFMDFVWFEIISAVSISLCSGCDVAMIYDSLDAIEDHKGKQAHFLGQRFFYSQLGETVAAVLGGTLAASSLALPAKVNAVTAWIPLLVSLTLTEPPRKVFASRHHWENIKFIVSNLFMQTRLLRLLIIFNILYGFSTYVAVWAYQPFWQEVGVPTEYFGYLWASLNLLIAVVAKFAVSIERRVSSVLVIIVVALCPIIAYAGLALFPTQWGIAFMFLFALCRGLNGVILQDAINSRVSPILRATANSVCGLGMRGIFLIFGPLMGHVLDNRGFQVSFTLLATVFAILFFVLTLPILGLRGEFRSRSNDAHGHS